MKKISVLSISVLLIMSGASISPALGSISENFNPVNPLLIKMILTLPCILIMPASIISGNLSEKIKKRTLLITGLLVYLIGGVGGGFASNIYVLLAFRSLLGIGVGLILPLSTGLIVDFFEDEERKKMMGYSTAINNLGAVIAIILSGILGSVSWRFAFGVYFIALIPLLLVIFKLPEPKKRVSAEKSPLSLNKKVYKMMLLMAVVNIVFYSVPTNIAMLIKTQNLGSSSISGLVIASLNLTSFISGLFLTKFTNIFKKNATLYSLLMMLIGYIILSISNSLIQIELALILIGLGLGIVLTLIFIETSKSVSAKDSTFALALVNSCMYLGQFLSPLLINFIGNLLEITSIQFAFKFSTILLVISILVKIFSFENKAIYISPSQRNL
ncbi:MFS transporter [Tepidibacter hydrothermalis]|uniref:MFS transporter n=1 Tax=Tepidibacter hydrothermalis TaxID=3036126 RepID=A0ABY8E9E3_9FIRM|nr:MFS transporter [Tepidibacter hydrothermalis]WFD09546.1 MFS transporter [Tepidibacter hydrothermalis]